MVSKKILHWRVIPIWILLFLGLAWGLEDNAKVRAFLAYSHGDFNEALKLYAQISDNSGCGLVLCAANQPDEAIKYFQKAGDLSGLGLAYCNKRDFKKAYEYFK